MLVEKLNELYLKRAAAEAQPFRFRPSALGGCLRQQAFLLSGMEPLPNSPESERVFELGHQRGLRLEELLKEAYPDARTQVPVRIPLGKYEITGTADAWIPSLRTVVDFKTAGGFAAGLLAKDGVSVDYQLQVHAYRHAIAIDWAFSGDPDALFELTTRASIAPLCRSLRAVIIYECKDSDSRKGIRAGQLIEMEVPWTEGLEEQYQTRLREIEALLIRKDQGTLDPNVVVGLPKSHWRCRMEDDGTTPKYCPVGSIRGKCH